MPIAPRLGLLARWPLPGAVKTRLIPPLSADDAARLHAAFVADLMKTLEAVDVERWLLVDRQDGEPGTHGWPAWPIKLQRGADLGARLLQASRDLGAETGSPVVLVGSDHPSLPPRLVREAFAALEHTDLVLGPTFDGGYYLVGLSQLAPGLFEDIPWSTAQVLGATLDRARALGLKVAALDPWYDVDSAAELELLLQHLRLLEMAGERRCRRSRVLLAALASAAARHREPS